MKKNDSLKIVLDARHINSNADQSSESWPLELLAALLAWANNKYKAATDLMYANAHATLDNETIQVTGFPSGD